MRTGCRPLVEFTRPGQERRLKEKGSSEQVIDIKHEALGVEEPAGAGPPDRVLRHDGPGPAGPSIPEALACSGQSSARAPSTPEGLSCSAGTA